MQSALVTIVRKPSANRHQHVPMQCNSARSRQHGIKSEALGIRKDELFAEGQHYCFLDQGDKDTAEREDRQH